MKFQLDRRLEAELSRSPALRTFLLEEAERVKKLAEAEAPDHTGFYKSRFAVDADADGVTIGNTDPFAHLVEWGSIHNPAYAPLRRAARAAGLDLSE